MFEVTEQADGRLTVSISGPEGAQATVTRRARTPQQGWDLALDACDAAGIEILERGQGPDAISAREAAELAVQIFAGDNPTWEEPRQVEATIIWETVGSF